MKKTLTALILALALLTGSAAAFSDVDEGLYYAVPIAWAVERGITTGTSDDTFSPDALCTRGQIITFLWRAAGTPDPQSMDSAYGDVTPDMNQDIYKAILWAGEAGIIGPENLDDDRFIPSAPCGRSDAVLFLWRYSGSPQSGAPADFTDVFPEADYAQAVAWAVENGITSGTSESTFSPSEPCTRGQITTFLYRCVNEAAPGEKTPEDPAPPAQKPAESARPTRTYTGAGTAAPWAWTAARLPRTAPMTRRPPWTPTPLTRPSSPSRCPIRCIRPAPIPSASRTRRTPPRSTASPASGRTRPSPTSSPGRATPFSSSPPAPPGSCPALPPPYRRRGGRTASSPGGSSSPTGRGASASISWTASSSAARPAPIRPRVQVNAK